MLSTNEKKSSNEKENVLMHKGKQKLKKKKKKAP